MQFGFDRSRRPSTGENRPFRAARSAAVAALAFASTALGLVALSPLGGAVYGFTLAPGAIPLRTAGALVPIAVASVGIGPAYLYATALSVALFVPGALAGAALDRGATVAAVGLGVAAAASLTVVTGCHCGAGSAVPLLLKAL